VQYIYRGLLLQAPQSTARPARLHDPLYVLDSLETGANQKAGLRFTDGTVLLLNQRTIATLQSPARTSVGRGEVAEYLVPGSDHRVETTAAISSAIGTTFDVRFDGHQAVFIVLNGALQVANAAGSVVVTSNEETVVTGAQVPSPPQHVDAQLAFAWTAAIPTPDLGQNLALDANGGQVIAASSTRGANWQAQYINDGLLTTGWESGEGRVAHESVVVALSGKRIFPVTELIIDPSATVGSPADMALKDFELLVSTTTSDPGAFTTVFGGTCKHPTGLQVFHLPAAVQARYVELVAIDNFGSKHGVAVAEMEVVAMTAGWLDPSGVAVDAQGHIFVADGLNDRLWKLSADGVALGTIGSKGTKPGQFESPGPLTVDRRGDLYVFSDFVGLEELVAGRRSHWRTLHVPVDSALAVDSGGDIYTAGGFSYVSKYSPQGSLVARWTVVAHALSVTKPASSLGATGVTVDRHDHVYVSDFVDHQIIEFTTGGLRLHTFRLPAASLGQILPGSLAVDRRGDIFVADEFRLVLAEILPSGAVHLLWTRPRSLGGGIPQLALDPNGRIYLTASGANHVLVFSPKGVLRATWGVAAVDASVLGAGAIAVGPQDKVYVVDAGVIQKRAPDGHVLEQLGRVQLPGRPPKLGWFQAPTSLAVGDDGAIYVVDGYGSSLQKLTDQGPEGFIGPRIRLGLYSEVFGVGADYRGNVYVAEYPVDRAGSVILKFSASGALIARLKPRYDPVAISTTRNGTLVVAEEHFEPLSHAGRAYESFVEKLSPNGKSLKRWRLPFDPNCFSYPTGITADPAGHVYVAGFPCGLLEYAADGRLLRTQSIYVRSIAGDHEGNIYVTNGDPMYGFFGPHVNNQIVKLSPRGKIIAIWR
jgi:hypothetical protein